MTQTAKLKGALSDGSTYIFYTKDNQQIFKNVIVNEVLFTVCRLHERVLENPKGKHIYIHTYCRCKSAGICLCYFGF
jgi:hypothetical protein